MAVPCKVELNNSLQLLGCPNPKDQVLLIKADGSLPILVPYATFFSCLLPPRDIWSIVGSDSDAPVDGSSSWQDLRFANYHVELTVNEVPIFYVDQGKAAPQDGTFYYTKAAASDTAFGGNNLVFRNGDRVHARMYVGKEDVSSPYIVEEDGTTNIIDETGTNSFTSD